MLNNSKTTMLNKLYKKAEHISDGIAANVLKEIKALEPIKYSYYE